jgi:hypothetical protein
MGRLGLERVRRVLTEEMVGEIVLILVSVRVNGEDEKEGWLWELLCW